MRLISCVSASLFALVCAAFAGEQRPLRLPMPPGMARADDAKQVAALYSETHQKRVEAIQKAHLDQQLQIERETNARRIQSMENELRLLQPAENRDRARTQSTNDASGHACRVEYRERACKPEPRLTQSEIAHAIQRRINEEYQREQRLIKALKH